VQSQSLVEYQNKALASRLKLQMEENAALKQQVADLTSQLSSLEAGWLEIET